MLYLTSFKDKEVEKEINKAVGKPFNIKDIIFKKVGIIGSSRMEVIEYSSLFVEAMNKRKQAVQANIGLRPRGIVVVLNIRLSDYTWVIPYRYLSIFKTDILVIHSQGEFLKLKLSQDQNKSFIEKILKLKNEENEGEGYYG